MSQRMSLSLADGPNPPWTNLYFDCECGARYQLGASDELKPIEGARRTAFETFPCWTCEKRNVVTVS